MSKNNNINNKNSEAKSEKIVSEIPEIEELKERIGEITRERDEYLDGWKRAKADLINYKKEELSRLENVVKFGSEELIHDLVPVLDSFELCLASLEKAGPADKGIYMIKGQLEDILKRRGLEKIKITLGETFNPNYHESVGIAEVDSSDNSYQSGTIAEEVETGYIFQGKVLRPVRVKLVN